MKTLFKSFGLAAISFSLLAGTASAAQNPVSWNNTVDWNTEGKWSKPYTGTFSLIWTSTTGRFQAALTNLKWDPDQVLNFDSHGWYPTLDIREDGGAGHIRGVTWAYSNFYDPKYDFEDDGTTGIDEVEVVERSISDFQAYNAYKFETYWDVYNHNYNDYMIAYSPASSAPWYPGGDYNTVYPTGSNSLAGIYKNDIMGGSALALTAPLETTNQSNLESSVKTDKSIEISQKPKKNKNDFDKIKTKEDLDSYKVMSDKYLDSAKDDETKTFFITFKKPVSIDRFKEIIKDQSFEISVVYGRSVTKDGEKWTPGSKGFEEKVWREIENNQERQFKGITQFEGAATAKTLKAIQQNNDIFAVEVDAEDFIPMGLYYKLEKTENKN